MNKNTCKTFVLAQVSHARSKSAPATHQKGSESDTDGRRQSPQHWSPCRSNIHLVNIAGTSGNDEPRVDYSGTESQGEDEVDPSRILNALPLKIKSFICWIFSLNHCPVHR